MANLPVLARDRASEPQLGPDCAVGGCMYIHTVCPCTVQTHGMYIHIPHRTVPRDDLQADADSGRARNNALVWG